MIKCCSCGGRYVHQGVSFEPGQSGCCSQGRHWLVYISFICIICGFFLRSALDHIHSILTLFTASCEKEDDERELKRELLKLLRRRGNWSITPPNETFFLLEPTKRTREVILPVNTLFLTTVYHRLINFPMHGVE